MANVTSALPLEPLHGSVDPALSQTSLLQGAGRPLWAGPSLVAVPWASGTPLDREPQVLSLVTLKLLPFPAYSLGWSFIWGLSVQVLTCDSGHPVLLQCEE